MTAVRYEVALRALELREGHRVLEAGCGHGVAIDLIAGRVGAAGRVHGLDRSAKMIDQARRHNAAHVERGVASFEVATLQAAELEAAAFDRAVAIRVRELWTDPEHTLPQLQRCLRPGGRLVIVLDAPGGRTEGLPLRELGVALRDHGLVDVDTPAVPQDGAVAVVAHTADAADGRPAA